jgi:alkyl hydroperoxide reductase subunit AhpC
MSAYSRDLPKFAELNAQVVGISTDSIYSHLAWQEKSIGWQEYPLASDYWPHGGTAQKYGILREGDPLPGINERAVFIVDEQGKIVFSRLYELGQEPDNQECLDALRKLGSGG